MNTALRHPLLWILLAVCAASLAYSFSFRIKPAVDAKAYDRIAWNLAEGYGYRESRDVAHAEDNAIVRVGPGYEFFLAGIYTVFGRSLPAAWVANAILLAAAALLVYATALKIFFHLPLAERRTVGLIAAALVGLSPDLITISGMLMSETLAVFLIALAAFFFFHYWRSAEKPLWLTFLLGLSLGAAAMVRTPAALLALPVLVYFFSERRWKEIAVIAVAIVALFSPWVVRNYKVYNALVITNLAYGVDLAFGNHPGASGELEHYEPAYENIRTYGYVAGNRKNAVETLRFIASSPLEFARLTFYRASIYFSFARPTGFWFHLAGFSRAATLVLSALYSAIIFLFGAAGVSLLRQFGDDRRVARYLLALAVMMPLSVIFIIVETRYRFLLYPLLAVFAGYALSDIAYHPKSWGGDKLRAALLIVLLFLANTGLDAVRNLSLIFERLNDLN